MSYDLYLYKPKVSSLSEQDLRSYLTKYIQSSDEHPNQWVADNEDTGTYFSLELYENFEEYPEENPEFLNEFENTGLTFNINLIRPDFFGIEAFAFIAKMLQDLGLYVLNPQTDDERPVQPAEDELFNNWSKINESSSKHFVEQMGLEYVPISESNEVYKYKANRKTMQEHLGENYYVPQLYFFKYLPENKIVTISTWAESIPNVFPPADFFFLVRKIKKLFRTLNETVIIKAETLNQEFGHLLKTLDSGYRVIHPEEAAKAKKLFNSIGPDTEVNSFQGVPIEKLTNVQP